METSDQLAALLTETRNPASTIIDTLPTEEMLHIFNDEDARIATAVGMEIPSIARAVDAIAERFALGGRLFYIGAGTSGRLGVLDASECPPTFSVPRSLFVGIIAGGDNALRTSAEKAEDSPQQGADDLAAARFGRTMDDPTAPNGHRCIDTLVGITASGRTPYVLGAIKQANSVHALTVGISCVPHSRLAQTAQIAITPAVGPEVVTGSTRMKAGTATKLVLNMLSTGIMIRSGYVYGNLMVNVQPTNDKLVDRAARIISAATSCDHDTALELLKAASGSVKTAITMQRLNLSRQDAEAALEQHHGNLRTTLGE